MSEIIEKLVRDNCPGAVVGTKDVGGVLHIEIRPDDLLAVCDALKTKAEPAFDYMMDITAVDWTDRFEVVFQFMSFENMGKIALRVSLPHDNPEVDSITGIWRGADYQEREVYDLMGIVFRNHPNLKRILLPEDWEGYPLRKDYVIPD